MHNPNYIILYFILTFRAYMSIKIPLSISQKVILHTYLNNLPLFLLILNQNPDIRITISALL